VYRDNTAKFYGATGDMNRVTVGNTIGGNFEEIGNSCGVAN